MTSEQLSTILALDAPEAAAALQTEPQRFISPLRNASPQQIERVAELLESLWPKGGLHSGIKQEGHQWEIAHPVYTILELGPTVNLPLNPERWAEVASCGFTFTDQIDWLRTQYSLEGAELAAEAQVDDVRSWHQIVSSIPSGVLPEAVVNAVVERMRRLRRDDDVLYLPHIGERLVQSDRRDALDALVEIDERFASALEPTLARAGDTEAAARLLDRLQKDITNGRDTHHLELEWLNGAHDPELLRPLFDCLMSALSHPDTRPLGPVPSLVSAIRRIGGVEAVNRYDDLIASSDEGNFKFMAPAREDVAQDVLRRAGAEAAATAAAALGLPLITA